MGNKSLFSKHFDFILLDIISLALSFCFAYFYRYGNFGVFEYQIYRDMLFVVMSINIIVCFFYEPYSEVMRRDYIEEFNATVSYDVICFLMCVLYMFVVKISSNYSRITMVLTYAIYVVLSYIIRMAWKMAIKKKSNSGKLHDSASLLIMCEQDDIMSITKSVNKYNYGNYHISGICLTNNIDEVKEYNNYKIVANMNTVLKYISTNWVDDILIAIDYKNIPLHILKGLEESGITLHFTLSDAVRFEGKVQTLERLGEINVITVAKRNYSNYQRLMKRAIDIFGGLFGCFATLLIAIVIGPIIYIKSPGKIIYTSKRVGKNGKIFNFYKFRSMVLDADELKEKLQEQNIVKDGLMFKIKNDPRIIPGIGTFIRKTSLDEFPQFINVLKGDMSLVGTRPPTLDEWHKYDPYYRSRLSIKPGITGLWQVSGRSNITDFDEVVRLDNEYIDNWSISLDIKILLKTIVVLFERDDNGAM